MIKQPWKGHTRDSCQKHVDDNHLFTSIRHHTMPFVVPKPIPGEKVVSPEKKLEKEIENKFLSGNYRFSDALKAIAIIVKPLFLICVLPFYLGFYLIPTWLCWQGKHFYSQLTSKINQISTSFKSKITLFFNPVKVYRTKIVNFKSNLIQRIRSSRESLKLKFQELVAPIKLFKLKIKKIASEISGRFYEIISKIKSRWLEIISKAKGCKKSMQDLLSKAIKAPFIYLAEKARIGANKIHSRIIDPIRLRYVACVKFINGTLQNITDRKNQFIGKVKDNILILKAKIIGLKNISFGQGYVIKVKSIKISAFVTIKNLKKSAFQYVESVNFLDLTRYINQMKARWESLIKGPKERYQFIQQQINKYKSDLRHFAIHLPSNIKKKIPELLSRIEKQNNKLSGYVKERSSQVSDKLYTLKKFVPAPLRQAVQQASIFYTKAKTVIGEKRQELVWMVLILQVWVKVIVKYSKSLVTSHRFTKLIKFEQSSPASELDS